jgi:2-hydroxy-4-carboxymuconate semialdehyde hemiacetal dehydrogenase
MIDIAVNSELGLCLVGPGGVAGLHLEALTAVGMTRNVCVVGPIEDEVEQFAQRWTFDTATTSFGEALANPAVELVLITSPSMLHGQQTREALLAGKHVIVEIPAALTADEGEQLAGLARSVGRRLLVCHTMRSFPGVRSVRDRARSGELRVAQIAGMFAVPRRENENWTGGTRAWVDNLLWHHGCHVVDASLWMLDCTDVVEVTAQAGQQHPIFGMTMDLSLTFSTPNRQIVTHCLSYNTTHGVNEMQLVTDDDFFVLRDGALIATNGGGNVACAGWSDLGPQDLEMLRAIVDRRPSEFDIDAVLPTMRVLQMAQTVGGSR